MTDSPTSQAMHLAMTELEYRSERITDLYAQINTLQQALEIIAVGDSQNPRADAVEALRSAGLWKAESARSVLNKETNRG